MSIKINYSNKIISKPLINQVMFVEENFSISAIKKHLSNTEFSYINDLLKKSDLKKNLLLFPITFIEIVLLSFFDL